MIRHGVPDIPLTYTVHKRTIGTLITISFFFRMKRSLSLASHDTAGFLQALFYPLFRSFEDNDAISRAKLVISLDFRATC